ncbi:MAG: hypothetical protein ACM3ZA_13050 [Bacillota bacterium]
MRKVLVLPIVLSVLVGIAMAGSGCARAGAAPATRQQPAAAAQLGDWSADVVVEGGKATVSTVTPGVTISWEYHLHLSLDGGPVIMASYPTYTFENVGPGKHTVEVLIAGPDHAALQGGEKVLTFEVR